MALTSKKVDSTTTVPCQVGEIDRAPGAIDGVDATSEGEQQGDGRIQQYVPAVQAGAGDGIVSGLLMGLQIDLLGKRLRNLAAVPEYGRDLALIEPAARGRGGQQQQ